MMSDAFRKVDGELLRYLDLLEDWDGYGGLIPGEDVVISVIELLKVVESEGYAAPSPMVCGDGEVGLSWSTQGVYVEIGCEKPGLYDYLVVRGQDAVGEDDFNIELGLPATLKEALKEVTNPTEEATKCSES
jgi:hypothetical protein